MSSGIPTWLTTLRKNKWIPGIILCNLSGIGSILILYSLFNFFFMATVHDEQPVMGNILKLLTREEQDSGGNKIDIFLDFESKF